MGISLFRLLFPETKAEIEENLALTEGIAERLGIPSPSAPSPAPVAVEPPPTTQAPPEVILAPPVGGQRGILPVTGATLQLPISFPNLIDSISAAQLPGLVGTVILSQNIFVPAGGQTTVLIQVPDGYVLAGLGSLTVASDPPVTSLNVIVGTMPLAIDVPLTRPRELPLTAGVQLLPITGVITNPSSDDAYVDFFVPLAVIRIDVWRDVIHPILLLNYQALAELATNSTASQVGAGG
jgi:hypothetical protein